ncbi:MvaI/BcnI family restriction endonuclease [Candidatus Latescibacterota bacterium]
MMTFAEIAEKLRNIKKNGYYKTHRSGPTGIGKTLEDLLGIIENNIPGPNAVRLELKSARKNTGSMLTLFTKSPDPPRINSVLLGRFGYPSSKGTDSNELHTTVNARDFNSLRGSPGFKIGIESDRITLLIIGDHAVCYWPKNKLQHSFERKLPNLLYVKANARGRGINEEFWYNEAWVLSGFSFEGFIHLLQEGTILVDIRIGQYPDGRSHDHGTGFRVMPDNLDMCFDKRQRVL